MALHDLAAMTTATTGTGTITLGSAVTGALTFAAAGVSNGEIVTYGITDGANSEVGWGVYTTSGTTLTRTVLASTNSGSAISLSGAAIVFVTTLAESGFVNAQTGAAYTISASDGNNIVTLSNSGAIAVTLPNNLPAGFQCVCIQMGAGQVTFSAQSGGSLSSASSFTKTRVQYAAVGVAVVSNSGTNGAWVLTGDGA